jgi:DHA1 family tetracycline resistance protein-like MFS transporter
MNLPLRTLRISPFALIFSAVVIDLLGYGIVVPLLPLTITRLGGSATLVGVLTALYALIQAICGPMLGALSDRVGRRPVLLACLLGTGLGYLLLGLADSLALLVAALLLDAATGANLSTAQAYVADQSAPAARARNFGLLGVALGLGLTAGPALGGLLSRFGPGAPALAAAGLAFANLLFALLALPESLAPERRAPWAWRIPRLAEAGALWRRSALLRNVLVTITLVNLAFAGLQSNFPIYAAARFGWAAGDVGALFAWVGLWAVLSQGLLLGRLRERFSERSLALAGVGLMAACLPWLGLLPQGWMLYPAAAAIALGSSLCIPTLSSMLAERAGDAAQGRAMGVQQVAINLALVGGPLLAGLAYDQLGPWAPYALGGAWALLGLLALYHAER